MLAIVEDECEVFAPTQHDIGDMLEWAKSIVVDSDDSYGMLYDIYCNARQSKNLLDSRRKELTEPLRRRTAYINGKAKPVLDILDEVIKITNAKANDYRMILESKHKDLIDMASIFDADGVYIPPVESPAMNGTIAVKKYKRFAVTNIDNVPSKYLKLDEEAVERDLKLGINIIPGLEIFEETTTTLRVR